MSIVIAALAASVVCLAVICCCGILYTLHNERIRMRELANCELFGWDTKKSIDSLAPHTATTLRLIGAPGIRVWLAVKVHPWWSKDAGLRTIATYQIPDGDILDIKVDADTASQDLVVLTSGRITYRLVDLATEKQYGPMNDMTPVVV